MESTPEYIEQMISNRLQQAIDTIAEVEFQIEHEYFKIAVNRMYYGIFYLLLALSLKHGFKTSKHQQLIGWFNKEFIITGVLDVKFGKIVHKAFADRTDGDYGVFVEFSKDEVLMKLKEMKLFVTEVSKLL